MLSKFSTVIQNAVDAVSLFCYAFKFSVVPLYNAYFNTSLYLKL
jgi:hypothetical protein